MSNQENHTNLNLTDIADAVKVIDHAADQGAFRGWGNIRQILALRDRLDSFVTIATQATEEAPAAPPNPLSNAEHTDYSDIAPVTESLPPMASRRRVRAGASH